MVLLCYPYFGDAFREGFEKQRKVTMLKSIDRTLSILDRRAPALYNKVLCYSNAPLQPLIIINQNVESIFWGVFYFHFCKTRSRINKKL